MDDDMLEERPWYARRGFIAAAAFLAVVALLGVILLLTGDGGADDDPPVATPTPTVEPSSDAGPTTTSAPDDTTVTSAPQPPPAAAGDCPDLAGTDGDGAIAAAPDVQWSPVGEVAAAISEDNGPALRDGIKRCFAHTPEGALLAAYNFLADVRTGTNEPLNVIESRVDSTSAGYDVLRGYALEPRNLVSISVVAYRFLEVSEDRVTVALVQRLPGSSSGPLYARDEVTVEWREGDWWVTTVLDPEQVDAPPPDYIEWGPDVGNPE